MPAGPRLLSVTITSKSWDVCKSMEPRQRLRARGLQYADTIKETIGLSDIEATPLLDEHPVIPREQLVSLALRPWTVRSICALERAVIYVALVADANLEPGSPHSHAVVVILVAVTRVPLVELADEIDRAPRDVDAYEADHPRFDPEPDIMRPLV